MRRISSEVFRAQHVTMLRVKFVWNGLGGFVWCAGMSSEQRGELIDGIDKVALLIWGEERVGGDSSHDTGSLLISGKSVEESPSEGEQAVVWCVGAGWGTFVPWHNRENR